MTMARLPVRRSTTISPRWNISCLHARRARRRRTPRKTRSVESMVVLSPATPVASSGTALPLPTGLRRGPFEDRVVEATAMESINPATGEVLGTVSEYTAAEVERILAASERAFHEWRACSVAERADRMLEAARLLRAKARESAQAMALEMGKPVSQGEAEVEKCALGCEFYAEHAERFLAEEPHATDASRSYVRFDPLGPLLAVMPWNFPFWQVFRFAAPALMAGNAAVLKHASNVPRCALEIEQLFRAAGFPESLFSTVLVGSGRVSTLIADRRIRAVTLTGSDHAGSEVAATAGRELKKTVLELGGSDPFLVLADADLAAAARTAASARLVNSGQSCIAAKRFIVVEPVADAFVERFARELGSRRVGDPLDRATQVGPLARADLRDSLHEQVQESVKRGAKLLLGGAIPA